MGTFLLHDFAPLFSSPDIHDSCLAVIREGKYRTGDLGGRASTSDFTAAICEKVVAAQ